MIDSGQADYAVIVDAEGSRYTQEAHAGAARRAGRDGGRPALAVRHADARLRVGAMVLGRADRHPEGHRVVGGVSRAGTEHHDLCVGDLDPDAHRHQAAVRRRARAGPRHLADAKAEFDWGGIDWFVAHQTSVVHIRRDGATRSALTRRVSR